MSLEKEAPALVIFTAPMGERAARVHVLTEAQGLTRGVAYGVTNQTARALWQLGNVVKTRMRQRREGGVLTFSGEVMEAYAVRLFEVPLALDLVQSVCALLNTTLLEHDPCPFLWAQTLYFLASLCDLCKTHKRREDEAVPLYIRWEVLLLQTLGFGLDFSCCAVTGDRENLVYVSPRTGRAVSEDGAGIWRDRLLSLPEFLLREEKKGAPFQWLEGLHLTGYFLQRHVYDQYHRPMPIIRQRLSERIKKLVRQTNAYNS
ncbi:MAG: DNA repair protein RecO [Acetobacter sp.]|nr:DNA repair protein RecO [Acetobacter sp.]